MNPLCSSLAWTHSGDVGTIGQWSKASSKVLGWAGRRSLEIRWSLVENPNGRGSQTLPTVPADGNGQPVENALVIAIVVEDLLPPISPTHDMVDGARKFNSQRSAHRPSLATRRRPLNREPDLTPSI
jgi:hypothetical protein